MCTHTNTNAYVPIYFHIQVYKHIEKDSQKNTQKASYTLGGLSSAYTMLRFWRAVKELFNIFTFVSYFQENTDSNPKTLTVEYI